MPLMQLLILVLYILYTPAPYACDKCRARKVKYDEGRPACSNCKENNLICLYKEFPPYNWLLDTDPQARLEKTAQRILDKI
ncbi:hypothetical protein IFM47457_11250 [Aspergillus lentulus]|nr:hypothetical protein IFM47457_11250 [Aspergillus lentulus]